MGNYKIAVIKGDGIGPEVITEGVKVLDFIEEKFGHTFEFQEVLAGGAAIDATGNCLPEETLTVCQNSDGVLLGAVGGPKWDHVKGDQRPERALLGLREHLGLYANLRPAIIHTALSDASPIKKEIIGDDLDILIVRELTGGIYFGDRGYRDGKYGNEAYDTEAYSEKEVERIGIIAFESAMARNKKLMSVDKANVLESSRLWRKVMTELHKKYPEVTLDHMYVDNAAMQLVRDPKQFDVIVTSNMFGDILSDEASQITGSIGMLPSASLGEGAFGMYEPIHGSAPDIAGKNMANPIATILSIGMMLKYTLNLPKESKAIEVAVESVLNGGARTADIVTSGTPIGTKEMGELILAELKK
ncbi:MAG: 3-isopropylmalate dehydrogenase [Bacillota bacterium]